MPVFEHRDLPLLEIPRIRTRVLVSAERGATATEVWEQEMPADGHIPLHYHDVEEVLVLLSGVVELQLGDELQRATAPARQPHSLRPDSEETVHLLAFFPCVSPNNFTPEGKPVRLPWQPALPDG